MPEQYLFLYIYYRYTQDCQTENPPSPKFMTGASHAKPQADTHAV
jgi:hypothetical protein